MGIIKKLGSYLLNVILVILILLCIVLYLPKAMGYKSYTVLSGSMLPKYKIGSVVFSKDINISQDTLKVGDVIVFNKGSKKITHRVYSIDWDTNLITTKGDNNSSTDSQPVLFNEVEGKVVYNIPYIGYISIVMRNKSVFTIIMILVCSILIFNGIHHFFNKKDKLEAGENIEKK